MYLALDTCRVDAVGLFVVDAYELGHGMCIEETRTKGLDRDLMKQFT